MARKNSENIGFIGAGEQAKTHFLALMNVMPTIKKCFVSSRTLQSEKKFVEQMIKFYPKVQFVLCNSDYEKAIVDSDIIVTAISGQEKILKANWIKKGAFYCHVGGLEDEYEVAKKASKIVCDDWNVVKHRTQTISRMYKEGILKDNDIYGNLYEIVGKRKNGREKDDEFIYFNSVGLSYVDIALANDMYKKVINKKLGKMIKIQNMNMFDVNENKFIL